MTYRQQDLNSEYLSMAITLLVAYLMLAAGALLHLKSFVIVSIILIIAILIFCLMAIGD